MGIFIINKMKKKNIIEKLVKINCIKKGNFVLRSGKESEYYFDMKNIISCPKLLVEIGDEMYKLIKNCDILCGVPYGGLPICSYISTKYNIPMIMPRTNEKNYGTKKQIEGTYKINDKCVIIEDVITTGGSVNEILDLLDGKVNVIQAVSILDREEGNKCKCETVSVIYKSDVI